MWMSTSEDATGLSRSLDVQLLDDGSMKIEQLVGGCSTHTCCDEQSSKAASSSSSSHQDAVSGEVVRGLIGAFQSLGLAAFQPGQHVCGEPKDLLAELRLLRFLASTSPLPSSLHNHKNSAQQQQLGTSLSSTDDDLMSATSPITTAGGLLLSRAPLLRFLGDVESLLGGATAGALLEGQEEGKADEPDDNTTTIVGSWGGEVVVIRDPYPTPRRKALLIANSATDALRLAERARGDGFAVEVARTALAGLALLAVRAFDVVVSELAFPMVNGIEMVRRLRHFENDGEFHRRRGSSAARSAFVVLVRNGVGNAAAVQARSLRGGADHFVETFDHVRFSSLHHLLDEVASEPSTPAMVVSTREAEARPIPPPLFTPQEEETPMQPPQQEAIQLLPPQLPLLPATPSHSNLSQVSCASSCCSASYQLPPSAPMSLHGSIADSTTTLPPPPALKPTTHKRKAPSAAAAADAPKIRRACSYCHTKKVSCSCTRPCNRCMELDLPCTDYEPRPRSKRPRTNRPSAQGQAPQPPQPLTVGPAVHHHGFQPLQHHQQRPTSSSPPAAVLVPNHDSPTSSYIFNPQQLGASSSRSASPQASPPSTASSPSRHVAATHQAAMVFSTSTMTDYHRMQPRAMLMPSLAPPQQPALYILHPPADDTAPLLEPPTDLPPGQGGGLFRTASEQNFFTSLQAAKRQAQPQPWVAAAAACAGNGYMQQRQPSEQVFATVFDEQVFM